MTSTASDISPRFLLGFMSTATWNKLQTTINKMPQVFCIVFMVTFWLLEVDNDDSMLMVLWKRNSQYAAMWIRTLEWMSLINKFRNHAEMKIFRNHFLYVGMYVLLRTMPIEYSLKSSNTQFNFFLYISFIIEKLLGIGIYNTEMNRSQGAHRTIFARVCMGCTRS